jgi:hypothetical protein
VIWFEVIRAFFLDLIIVRLLLYKVAQKLELGLGMKVEFLIVLGCVMMFLNHVGIGPLGVEPFKCVCSSG